MKYNLCFDSSKKIFPCVQALKHPRKCLQPSSPTSQSSTGFKKTFSQQKIKTKKMLSRLRNDLKDTRAEETLSQQGKNCLQLRLKLRPFIGTEKKHLKRPATIKPWRIRHQETSVEKYCLSVEEEAIFRPFSSDILIEKQQNELSYIQKILYWRKKSLAQYKFSKNIFKSAQSPSNSFLFSLNKLKPYNFSLSPSSSPRNFNVNESKTSIQLRDLVIEPSLEKVYSYSP